MRPRLGGTEGNEALTVTTAALLTGLLIAEGITLLHLNGLVGAHMFIGLALIPPLLVKLASTGYRFARYYTGSRAYRVKGPPHVVMRALAVALVLSTVGIFVTGVLLLAAGHQAGLLLGLHKASFVVWSAAFGIHFLVYIPRVLGSLPDAWRATRRPAGAALRGLLVSAATGGGVALGVVLLPTINRWHP